MVQSSNPGIQDTEVGGSEVKGFLQLYGKFQANTGYIRPCLRKKFVKVTIKSSYHNKNKYLSSKYPLPPGS